MKQLKQELIGKVLTSSMYDEIQAEALEKAGSRRAKGISEVCRGYNRAMSEVQEEAAKLREQKDEAV